MSNEVHLGSWRRGLSYVQLAEELTAYVVDNGFTHVEMLPVTEYPYEPSWGYQVTSYFAPTSRFGSPDEFRYLIDRLHQAGISVIMDWVPPTSRRTRGLWAASTALRCTNIPTHAAGEQLDWGTFVFNSVAARSATSWSPMQCSGWSSSIDGLRVDAVASMLYLDYSREEGEWLPNEYGGRENLEAVAFLQEMNATVYKRCPGVVTVAEESTAWLA